MYEYSLNTTFDEEKASSFYVCFGIGRNGTTVTQEAKKGKHNMKLLYTILSCLRCLWKLCGSYEIRIDDGKKNWSAERMKIVLKNLNEKLNENDLIDGHEGSSYNWNPK